MNSRQAVEESRTGAYAFLPDGRRVVAFKALGESLAYFIERPGTGYRNLLESDGVDVESLDWQSNQSLNGGTAAMGRKKTDHAAEDAQPPLVPMSDAEIKAAGKKLAQKVRDLEVLKKEDAEAASDAKEQRDKLANEISAIASTIRSHGR